MELANSMYLYIDFNLWKYINEINKYFDDCEYRKANEPLVKLSQSLNLGYIKKSNKQIKRYKQNVDQ